ENAERWVHDWERSLQEQAAKAKTFADRGATITATATDKDRVVEVTVDASGAVTGLNLSERIRKMAAHEVGDLILSVMRKAQAQLFQQNAQVATETMGEDSQVGRSVVASYEQRFPTA